MLEGIRLPAARGDLIAYARRYDASIAAELEALPDDEFDRLDAVGELLRDVPSSPRPEPEAPRPESGEPPGGPDYVKPSPANTGESRGSTAPS